MELQLFVKGLSKWFSSNILYLAGHRVDSTWLLTVLSSELPSSFWLIMPLHVLRELQCYHFEARGGRAFTTLSILIHVALSSSAAVFRPTTPLFWVNDLGNS